MSKPTYEELVAQCFMATGQVPAGLLLGELVNRLPKGNTTREILKSILRDTQVALAPVDADLKAQQEADKAKADSPIVLPEYKT